MSYKISIDWYVEDVLSQDETLTEDQSIEVLDLYDFFFLHAAVEIDFVHQGCVLEHFEVADLAVADVFDVFDERADRVAVGDDEDVLAVANTREDDTEVKRYGALVDVAE